MKSPVERVTESPVPAGTEERRLDLYLAARFNYLSRTAWQREIESSRVFVNGEAVKSPGKKIRSGDIVSYRAPAIDEPDIDPSFEIIYEDEQYLAVNKSGNLPVHPSGVFFNNTLVMLIESRLGIKLYPVHRLDRETSGVILLGRDPAAASAAQREFGTFCKRYRAVVKGVPGKEEFIIDVPLGPARSSVVRKKREAYSGAPETACTRFRVLSSSEGFSLLEAVPVTGRMHQIRAHLSYARLPILGDKLYGDDERVYLDYVEHGMTEEIELRAGFRRCALHARSLSFTHPFTGKSVEITAPVPADMKGLMELHGLASL